MDFSALLSDPRRRNLAVLGAAALLTLLLTLLVVWQQSNAGGPSDAPKQFFPGFAKEVRSAAHIHIASRAGTFDVVFVPEKGWVVPQRNDYPASYDLIQRTLVGMAALQTIEPKTNRADWLRYLGLDEPPRGDGIVMTIADDKNHVLAALVAGKSEDIGDPSGAAGLFVRHPGDSQAWLARAVFEPRPAIADWLNKDLMAVDRARIQEVDFEPAGSPAYTVSRAKPSDADFTLSPLPAGQKMPDATGPDALSSVITEFGFDDVRPARELDFANPATTARTVTKTFDGLKVTVNVVKSGADYWATISAETTGPANGDVAKEAAAINAHASGWAYKLPAFKGQLFTMTLDTLLKAQAAAPPPGTAPQ